MKFDRERLRERTVSAKDYIKKLSALYQKQFLRRTQNYQIKREIVEEIKGYAKNFWILAFSAEWCKDCAENIPVLALISEKSGLEVRIFGGLKKNPLDPSQKWRIPPSPTEVKLFNVDKIPLIIIFNEQTEEVGRIVERPPEGLSLEETILQLIKENENV